jgi:hypothetical protein
MRPRRIVFIAASVAVFAMALPRAQVKPWNNAGLSGPPSGAAGPAPRRDLSGTWDAGTPGIQPDRTHRRSVHPARRADVQSQSPRKRNANRASHRRQRPVVDDGRSDRLSTHRVVRTAAVPDRADVEPGADSVHVRETVACHLDRRSCATDQSRSAVVRLLGGSLGRRFHAGRQHGGNRRSNVARQRRESA